MFNCSLVLSCISSSESRGILDSSGARKLFLLYFFHIVFSARTCAARLLSRLVGWIVDLTNCTVLLVSLLSSFRPVAGGGAGGARAPPEISRLELNSATKVDVFY